MRVKLVYLGPLRALLATDREEIDLGEGPRSLDDLKASLASRPAPFPGCLRGVAFAVDDEIAAAGAPLRDGDVVQLLPPVCGG